MAEYGNWQAASAWGHIGSLGHIGVPGAAKVKAELQEGLGLATVISGPESSGLVQTLKEKIGLDPPATPSAALSSNHALIWSAPGMWMLLARRRDGFAELLVQLAPHAAVSDQSHARAALRLSGLRARDVLAKGARLDLHPSAFPTGAAASTTFAYMGVQLWRAPDEAGAPVFELLVPRSMAQSFWSWLSASAAEFGCAVSARG